MAPEAALERRLGPGDAAALVISNVIGVGIFTTPGIVAAMVPIQERCWRAATSWLFALIPVMFSYSGWNAAAYIAEEVRDPQRTVPIALAAGTGIVIAIYLALNVL